MRFNHYGVLSTIDSLPGCDQISVFHSTFVPLGKRNMGLGAIGHKARLSEAKHLGYDVAMCTVVLSNKPQILILEQNDWKLVHKFMSTKTGNEVGIFVKNLV